MDEIWIEETLHRGFRMRLKAEQILFDSRTEHQHLIIFENYNFGRMMMLDGVVQLASKDEFIYHEMMGHMALMAHGHPRKVLIIGGGDGGVLREVLKHPTLEQATLCEIDQSVIDLCSEYFPQVSDGAFQHPRANVVIADGCQLMKESRESYDVILVDSTDPIGPGAVLFTEEFYADCKARLAPGGILITQNGLPFVQAWELKQSADRFRAVGFADVWAFLATTPTYFGGPMCYGWASNDPALRRHSLEELTRRYEKAGLKTRFYRPDVHLGALALPGYVREIVE